MVICEWADPLWKQSKPSHSTSWVIPTLSQAEHHTVIFPKEKKNTCACGLGLNLCMCALTEKRWDTIVSRVVIKNTFVWSSCCWWRTGDQSAGADGTVHRDHAWVQLNVPGPPYQMVTVLYELDSAGQTPLCTQISRSGRGRCSGGDQQVVSLTTVQIT